MAKLSTSSVLQLYSVHFYLFENEANFFHFSDPRLDRRIYIWLQEQEPRKWMIQNNLEYVHGQFSVHATIFYTLQKQFFLKKWSFFFSLHSLSNVCIWLELMWFVPNAWIVHTIRCTFVFGDIQWGYSSWSTTLTQLIVH